MGAPPRPIGITFGAACSLLGAGVSLGSVGTSMSSPGGTSQTSHTLLSIVTPAGLMWVPIYAGVIALVVWLWRGDHAGRARVQATSPLVAWSLALVGAWAIARQFGTSWFTIWVTMILVISLEITLIVLAFRLHKSTPTDSTEALVLDVTMGLLLGWVTVLLVTHVAISGYVVGLRPTSESAVVVAAATLIAVAMFGVVLARALGGRISVAVGMAWGLLWVAVSRVTGSVVSLPISLIAAVAAVIVVAAAVATSDNAWIASGGPVSSRRG